MCLNSQRATSDIRSNLDQVALVATAILFILGFIVPSTIPWQLASLSLLVAVVYGLIRKFRSGQQIRVRSAEGSSKARGGDRLYRQAR